MQDFAAIEYKIVKWWNEIRPTVGTEIRPTVGAEIRPTVGMEIC